MGWKKKKNNELNKGVVGMLENLTFNHTHWRVKADEL